MAVRPTLPDTTAAAAAAVILLFSLQFAASRSPSTLHGNDVVAAAVAAESDPDTAEETSKFKSNPRLPSDNIKFEPVPESDPRHVPASEPKSEWEDTATVNSVPLTRLRFNDLRPIDRRFFTERFRYPGRECRHHRGGSGIHFPREMLPVVTEIIRYVDDPAIPMEIIRYVDDTATATQPKEAEEKKEMKEEHHHHHLRHTGRAFPRPVEAQPAAAELLKYVDDVAAAEAAAEAAAAQPKEEQKEEMKVEAVATTTSLPVRHNHHVRNGGRAFQRMMEARSADIEILKYEVAAEAAAAQPKEEEKKEPVATITGSPVHLSRYHLHRGGRAQPFGAETVRYTEAAAAQRKEDAEKKEMKTEAAAAHRSRHQHGEANSGDKNEGFSKYMMKYNNRNLQRFGHQKFVRHLPHKRGRESEDEEKEKKAGPSFVKRIRKFLDF